MKRFKARCLAAVAIVLGTTSAYTATAQSAGSVASFEPASLVDYHNGYWVTKFRPEGARVAVTVINDLHYDPETRRVTVYAQMRALGRAMAPAQVGPGECTEMRGETVCFHPDAVYLNGSGQELRKADGDGAWWVKHSWVLGGEGYDNCELRPAETYDNCLYVEGDLLADGLTMMIGGEASNGYQYYNTRMPVFGEKSVTYLVNRFGPKNTDPEAGEIDLTPMVKFALSFECRETASALDGVTRDCPTFTPAR